MPENGKGRGKGKKRAKATLPEKPETSPDISISSKNKAPKGDTLAPCQFYEEICCHANLSC